MAALLLVVVPPPPPELCPACCRRVLAFGADWCGPCTIERSVVVELASATKRARFVAELRDRLGAMGEGLTA